MKPDLAERIDAFERDAVSDKDYKLWTEQIGTLSSRAELVPGENFTAKDIEKYKTLLFSDARLDFDRLTEYREGFLLSMEDYGFLSNNPLLGLLIESSRHGNDPIQLLLRRNASLIFERPILHAVLNGYKSISKETFSEWRPSWDWNTDEFKDFDEHLDGIIFLTGLWPHDTEKKIAYNRFKRDIIDRIDSLQITIEDALGLLETDHFLSTHLALLDLCHRLEKAVGLPRVPHLLSFLENG